MRADILFKTAQSKSTGSGRVDIVIKHDILLVMVKPTEILANCTGFEWDHGNITKNWERYDVSTFECEQIFFNKSIIVTRDKEHSMSENRYYALGRTKMNRLLFAVFTVHDEKIRIISARDMMEAETERCLK